jgi:hypothetical protein
VSIEKKSLKNTLKPLVERTSVSYPHPFNADLDPDLASNINADPGPYHPDLKRNRREFQGNFILLKYDDSIKHPFSYFFGHFL